MINETAERLKLNPASLTSKIDSQVCLGISLSVQFLLEVSKKRLKSWNAIRRQKWQRKNLIHELKTKIVLLTSLDKNALLQNSGLV